MCVDVASFVVGDPNGCKCAGSWLNGGQKDDTRLQINVRDVCVCVSVCKTSAKSSSARDS